MRRAAIGFAVGTAGVLVFLLVLDPVAIWAVIREVHLPTFAVGLIATLLAVACWAESMRRILLAVGGDLGPARFFVTYGTGMLAKQVLPLGNAGGPAIMAYAVEREADLAFERSLAVVTVADALGLLSTIVLAFAGIGYVLLAVPPSGLVRAALVATVVVAAVLLTLGLLLAYRRATLRFLVLGVARLLRDTVGRLSGRLAAALSPGAVEAGLRRYVAAIDTVAARRRSLLLAGGLALAGWTLFAVPLYTSAAAAGAPIAFGLVLFVVPVGGLATAVPLPGGVGGVEFAVAGMLLATTAIDPAVAGAIVVLYRLCVYWFIVLLGVGSLAVTATSLRAIAGEAAEEAGLAER